MRGSGIDFAVFQEWIDDWETAIDYYRQAWMAGFHVNLLTETRRGAMRFACGRARERAAVVQAGANLRGGAPEPRGC
eukprot:3444335-Rhodomonas_salina.1